jgi:hypothetical protein
MSSSKRECATCQFFQNAQLAGNGWCTHPNRQLASDVRLLVRAKELACRNSWGDDLWVDKELPATTSPAPTPRNGGMIYVATQTDDEVTSVVDTTAKHVANPGRPGEVNADDEVTHTSVRSDVPASARRTVNDPNTPANDDQDDRVRIMARGSRDAILRARERHAQRRTPMRPMIEPKDPDSDADVGQTLETRDRHHYVPPTDRTGRPATTSSGPTLESTPPVPREEIHGKGTGLSPAVGPDSRFDSVPELKVDIELPRLRQFLRGPQAGSTSDPPAPTQLPDVSVSSYDLVLRRAREIKASSAGEPPRATPVRQALPPTAPDDKDIVTQSPPHASASPARRAQPETPTVVWDLDPDDIRIAFQRVREAIDQPLPMRLEQPARNDVHGHAHGDASPPATPEPPQPASYNEDDDLAHDAEWYPDEPDGIDSASSSLRSPEPESPRGSWWRSLNFGIRRKVTLDSWRDRAFVADTTRNDALRFDTRERDLDPFYDDEVTEPAYTDEEQWEGYGDPASSFDHDDPEFVDRYDAFEHRQVADMQHFATSETSWREDELDFPEPQPADWYETRAALLATRPPYQDDISPSPEPITAPPSIEGEHHLGPASGIRPVPAAPRQPPTYFAVDQPGGMNAFRAALFGVGDSDSGDVDGERTALVQRSTAESMKGRWPPGEGVSQVPGEDRVETSDATPPWWQHPVPVRPARRFERGSSLDIPDEILERDEGPRTFDVASKVPKCCRTCRSFRPSDNRDQGWCMNGDAFTHRQMVNAEALSCRSSIGDWWLAADQSWIPPEDVIHPQTPRTDRLMERQDSQNEPSRQDRRRVRTRRAV